MLVMANRRVCKKILRWVTLHLALHYPTLYNIVYKKADLVVGFLGASPLNIQFHRALLGDKWTKWTHLVSRLMSINLT